MWSDLLQIDEHTYYFCWFAGALVLEAAWWLSGIVVDFIWGDA